MVAKVDFKKSLKPLYDPTIKGFHIVEVHPMNFIMVDGAGNPNTSLEYQQAIEALYTISYGVKFAMKPDGFDHVVPPLEGLWWMDDMHEFTLENKYRWKWTMMIMQPEWVSLDVVEKVKNQRMTKGGSPSISGIRFETYSEGLSVQIMYIGAYTDEASTIKEMHRFILENGYQTKGKHHEIYLSDARKTAPEKLRTILRQSIKK